MAVGTGEPIDRHVGNGVTRTFAYGFTLLDAGDLTVLVDGVESTDFTVAGIGDAAGGAITFTTAPPSGAKVILLLVIDAQRLNQYQENGDLLSGTVNNDFDRLWQKAGITAYDVSNRTLLVPFDETVTDLPAAADRATTLLGFDANGNPMVQPALDVLRGIGKLIYDYGAWSEGGTLHDFGAWG